MKKIFGVIITIMILCTAGYAIQRNNKIHDIEVIHVEGDRIIYNNLTELMNASDLVIIGEYCKNTEQLIEYSFSDVFNKNIITDITSCNSISVEKVLKGNTDEKTIKISQRYGIDENQDKLITFSEMTPMNKGEQWIFFLSYDEINKIYWCSGDYTGRYPVPNEKINSICDEASTLIKERNKILYSKERIPDSKIESKMLSNEYVYTDLNGINYSLQTKEVAENVISVDNSITKCRNKLKASDFGLYSSDLINIELYCEILNTLDCSLK